MIVLGIETAGPRGSIALRRGDGTTRTIAFESTRQLGAELAPAIQRLLRESGLGPKRPPDLVVVNPGPGSYTGLRIGLAAAKGLAFAWGRPLAAVPTVDALEASAPADAPRVVVALDASRGDVYATSLQRTPEGAVRELGPEVLPLDALRARLRGPALVLGDAAPALADPDQGIVAAGEELAWPMADRLAALGLARHIQGERTCALRLCPIYFHVNEAEETRRKRSMKAHAG